MELRDLKVGDFVRTKYGISQYKYYDTSIGTLLCIPVKNGSQGTFANIEDIIKASDKLIDLVETKDIVKVRIDNIFVNYFVVDTFEDEEQNKVLGIACYEDGMLNTISEYRPLDTLEILEVLTHQQFNRMSYKVGE